MTRRDPTDAELAADLLSRYGFTADAIREGIAEGGSISVTVAGPPLVLSGLCEAGLCDLCRKALCTHGCHGSGRHDRAAGQTARCATTSQEGTS